MSFGGHRLLLPWSEQSARCRLASQTTMNQGPAFKGISEDLGSYCQRLATSVEQKIFSKGQGTTCSCKAEMILRPV